MENFISLVSSELQQAGCVLESYSPPYGVHALLYTRSARRVQLGFAKVEDHFLFVDWDRSDIRNIPALKTLYAHFSAFANQRFKTPHALRLQIPNLALVAVSRAEFAPEIITFAQSTSLEPWYGGEAGQLILVELERQQVISLASLSSGRHPRPGALPLGHAAQVIRAACGQAFTRG